MEKEFKTIDELVALLESRNVATDGETALALKRESYYAIVNGYKDTFLDRDAMQSSGSDVYKEGTTFRQIYDLYLFDRDMRNAVFPYLTRAESIMKNAVVYAFCERNREPDAYLDRSNYVSAKDMLFPDGFKGNRKAEHGKRTRALNRVNCKRSEAYFTCDFNDTYRLLRHLDTTIKAIFGGDLVAHLVALRREASNVIRILLPARRREEGMEGRAEIQGRRWELEAKTA